MSRSRETAGKGKMALSIDASSYDTAPEAKCHMLPCTINKDGEANVRQYFETSVREEDESLTAAFRGRPLNGQVVVLPAGYTGVVLREVGSAATEDQDRLLRADQRFTSFTAWNLDKPPSGDDQLSKALQWMDVAKALHQPVNEENSQKSVTGK
ncbi:ribonuclease H2 subunit C-like [Babylonia areolata]|uniref:ribonuclease H2 subunit C-like n=1 Tax=Babylonia areolata TaxID=304850 RepID=UPI003FD32D2B